MKKKLTAVALIVCMIAIMLVGATMAYFTDNEEATNTFTVGGQKLESYLADVDDLGDFQGETEVVLNGYFNESAEGKRSAPYFDIDIDGITTIQ